MNPALNNLLQWSVANSTANSDHAVLPATDHKIDPEAINQLFGGPSDSELMIASMSAIQSKDPEVTLEDKLVAFDNFEQLVENLDNANNLEPTELWAPLLECMSHEEEEIRKMAAWCVGTAVQNNIMCQRALLERGGLERLVSLATGRDQGEQVRRKAIYALSSACRNYQPAMDTLTALLANTGKKLGNVDATDMDACDALMENLRREASEVQN
ncbi:hypothetical protein K3495_g4451 [Podosphaera aphanis]|nr:hypothetical protein K3495_g4451 [Podosphaera aphanis]